MKSRHLQIVRDSYVHVLFAPDEAARLFYRRLFELAPETRELFPDDLGLQQKRLIDALSKIVAGLSRPAALTPALAALARRHVDYGVQERHYPLVEEALLHMIRHTAPVYDQLLEMAWREAYATVSDIMLASLKPASPDDDASVRAPSS